MKVIQVGIGGMGSAWLGAVQRSSAVEFAGFVEVSEGIAEQQAAAFGLDRGLIFRSLPEALAAVKADGVINVTPPQFHREISVTALDAGIPVLSEKPLAGTRADSQAIVDRANATGVLHMVTQNYRYTTITQTIKQTLDSGVLGAVGSVAVQFFKGPHFGGFREEMPYPLIVDMSIHHFDLLRFFLGSNHASVSGKSWNPPWSWYKGDASAAVHIVFENGVVANYTGSWCSQGQETTWNANWRFECEKGVLTLENDEVYIQELAGIEDRPGYRHVANAPKRRIERVAMPLEAQDYLLHEFYQAVTSGTPPATTAQDNIHTINLVFDIVAAFERA
jgi:predicted dehydrogenase